jgi:hypothetical protein
MSRPYVTITRASAGFGQTSITVNNADIAISILLIPKDR